MTVIHKQLTFDAVYLLNRQLLQKSRTWLVCSLSLFLLLFLTRHHEQFEVTTANSKFTIYIINKLNKTVLVPIWTHAYLLDRCFLGNELFTLVSSRKKNFTWCSSYVGLYDAPGTQISTASSSDVFLLIVCGFYDHKYWRTKFSLIDLHQILQTSAGKCLIG